MVFQLVIWWYGQGWKNLVDQSAKRFRKLSQFFSLPLLSRTLFSPWRRIITFPAKGIGNRIRASVDNLVSRMVGFVVRVLVILTAVILMILLGVFCIIELVVWPLLPFGIFAALIRGIF
jgi:hypothetical protein